MPKFSDFIRNPGTAGPPTQEGIAALGFVLSTDVPGFLGKYVRVDAAQSFTGPEKVQGRANLDAQTFSTSLTSLAGLTTGADQLAYTTGANTWAVTSITAFARTILDDTNAPGVRSTLGLGTAATANTGTASGEIALLQSGGVFAPARLGTGAPSSSNFLRGDGAWSAALTPTFTKSFVSAEQTITAAGTLSLAHGLAEPPRLMEPVMICKTAENGYSVNDIIPANLSVSSSASDNFGASFEISGSTNIVIRFGNNPVSSFLALNKTTGAAVALTNANWRLIVRAYA